MKCDKCGRVSLSEKKLVDLIDEMLQTDNGCVDIAKSISSHFSARGIRYPEKYQCINYPEGSDGYTLMLLNKGFNQAIDAMRSLNEGENVKGE